MNCCSKRHGYNQFEETASINSRDDLENSGQRVKYLKSNTSNVLEICRTVMTGISLILVLAVVCVFLSERTKLSTYFENISVDMTEVRDAAYQGQLFIENMDDNINSYGLFNKTDTFMSQSLANLKGLNVTYITDVLTEMNENLKKLASIVPIPESH
jgi:hypothetical protein